MWAQCAVRTVAGDNALDHVSNDSRLGNTIWFIFLRFFYCDWQERLSRGEHSKADNNRTITIVLNGLLFAARMLKFT